MVLLDVSEIDTYFCVYIHLRFKHAILGTHLLMSGCVGQ